MNDKLRQTKALPISLLLEERPCLVVGGGKVALRKVGHLLEAGADVSVVSPALCDEFPVDEIEYIPRMFEPQDIEGMTVVFAATNDRSINRQVLEACREKKILCSCVDGNWSQSDFTTPAIARHGNMTLTVSTGGQSCRQAKLVKDNLSRHLEMISSVELVVVGTDHHHLSLQEREPFQLTGARLQRTGFMLMHLWGVHEFIVLNTCNRIELVAVVSEKISRNGILRHTLGFDKLKESDFYMYRGMEAFEHLCMVSSGMLSQTPGETHIAAQIKQALADAQEAGWAGPMMQEWISTQLHVSKHIQTEIVPGLRTEEIEDLALNCLADRIAGLKEKTLLVLGSGMVGNGIISGGSSLFGKTIWCYHKNRPELPGGCSNVALCSFNCIKDRLGEADVVISATEAPGYVLHGGHEPFLDQEKEICLVDLGMPRNIDPALGGLASEITLLDLDDLKHWHRTRTGSLDEAFEKSRRIIDSHQEQYERIINSFKSRNA